MTTHDKNDGVNLAQAAGAALVGVAAGAAAVALSDKKNRDKVKGVLESGKEKATQMVKGGKSVVARK